MSSSSAGSPVDLLIFAQYGRTMLAAQTFEMMLASLTLAIEADPHRQGKNFERSLRRLVKRQVHAFHRASASEMSRRLDGKIDADVLSEVRGAIDWRDRLTHRYLRENLTQSSPPAIFDRAILPELVAVTKMFEALSSKMQAILMQRVEYLAAETGQHNRPAGVDEVFRDLADSILRPRRAN